MFFSPQNSGLGPGCLHVNTTTHHLVDGHHRERYFHGVNVVVKGPPWMPNISGPFDPFWSFVDEDMALLQENGLNGLRYKLINYAGHYDRQILSSTGWSN